LEKKGENLFSVTQKPILRKTQKIFFSIFFIMNYSRFFVSRIQRAYFYLEKNFVFRGYTVSKISFFTNYTTWQTSHFYSTDMVDPHAPLEMKIKKTKKKIFGSGKGGGVSA
jgi:hypothetical protein